MGLRGAGELEQGPAMCETAHDQQRARAADERISCGALMKKDVDPHRKRASRYGIDTGIAMSIVLLLTVACKLPNKVLIESKQGDVNREQSGKCSLSLRHRTGRAGIG